MLERANNKYPNRQAESVVPHLPPDTTSVRQAMVYEYKT